MPPQIATVVFAVGILGLFLLERDRKPQVSPALWVAFLWLSIAFSRTIGQWLGLAPTMESTDQLVEGNPFDRLIFTGLLVIGLIVLAARWRRTGTFLQANGPLLIFFLFAGASILWSDYPFVAFKRWVKAFGNLVMVLVILTESNPLAAIRRLFARMSLLLILLSILFIKYYPLLGRRYHPWTGEAIYQGVAIGGKNGLGVVCLILGLASLWRLIGLLSSGERPRRAGPLIAHGALLAMTLWLFWMANSVTSFVCFLIGAGLMLFVTLSKTARKPATVHVVVAGIISLALFAVFLDSDRSLIEALGRDATLTGRTELWADISRMNVNPVLGTGFESFWLGERAAYFWENYWWKPNQAHNGYLEILINLGWMGLTLHGIVMVWGYRNVIRSLRSDPVWGTLTLPFFVVIVLHNLTEAGFRGTQPVWIIFLLAVTVIPTLRAEKAKAYRAGA